MIEMYFLVIDMEIIQCYRYRTNLKSRKFVPFSNNLAQFRPKLATLLGKNWTLLTITVVRFGSKWVKLAKNGRNPGFFQIRFSTFWLGEPKCTESGLKKIQDLSKLGPIWPSLGLTLTTQTWPPVCLTCVFDLCVYVCMCVWGCFWWAQLIYTTRPRLTEKRHRFAQNSG